MFCYLACHLVLDMTLHRRNLVNILTDLKRTLQYEASWPEIRGLAYGSMMFSYSCIGSCLINCWDLDGSGNAFVTKCCTWESKYNRTNS